MLLFICHFRHRALYIRNWSMKILHYVTFSYVNWLQVAKTCLNNVIADLLYNNVSINVAVNIAKPHYSCFLFSLNFFLI